jgi:hypothetical protein
MTQEQKPSTLSGVDPFAPAHHDQLEQRWFEAPNSARRPSVRPSSPPPPPIGDNEADGWFR